MEDHCWGYKIKGKRFFQRVSLNARHSNWCCTSWETIHNNFYQKHLIKSFHFLFTVCFIYNLPPIHPALCLLGNQLILASIESSYLYLSASICPFSLSFWAQPDNSESVTQLSITAFHLCFWIRLFKNLHKNGFFSCIYLSLHSGQLECP